MREEKNGFEGGQAGKVAGNGGLKASPTAGTALTFRRLIAVAIFGLATLLVIAWVDEQSFEFAPAAYEELHMHSGKIKLVKPWKTSPYIALTTNGHVVKFSCNGPYQRNYWCADMEKIEFMKNKTYTIKSVGSGYFENRYVYEISDENNEVLICFDKQLQRFSDAASQGPIYIDLVAALLLIVLASVVFLKKEGV